MYDILKKLPIAEQIERLTEVLVTALSINGTKGEAEIADRIIDILRSFPYFQQHPDRIWTQKLKSDPLGRKNVFARITGKGLSKKTIVLHAHMDTVEIEDYGNQKEIANNPSLLLEFFKTWEEDPEVQNAALSGDWMFGRGALDMKSGIAVHLVNTLYFSQRLEEWEGEIILMLNPVEENQHTGVMEAVDELLQLREKDNLDYVMAVNNDFINPLYEGDKTKYIYSGAVGKLLPCFYIQGRETHVGQPLNGLDPTLAASYLNLLINTNMELTEDIDGELNLPPSILYHRDTKASYNVQTSVSSKLYFNLMVYERSPKEIMNQLKEIAREAAEAVKQHYERNYDLYRVKNRLPDKKNDLNWEMDVITFDELCTALKDQEVDVNGILDRIVEENPHMEPRQLCFHMVEVLKQYDNRSNPVIVLFYAPPYCPHNFLNEKVAEDKASLQIINDTISQMEKQSDEYFEIKQFFPYLSDSSYLSLHDTDEDLAALTENFPKWEKIYPVPIQKIKSLNIPAINVGVWGVDAHAWTERVFKPYSFQTLPTLLQLLIKNCLETKPEGVVQHVSTD